MSDTNEAADRLLKAGVGGFARMEDLVTVCRAAKCHDDLLAALEEIIAHPAAFFDCNTRGGRISAQARAAIAKAKGEQP